jgi:LL-diaminopimelate aminotransferase
MQIADRLLQTPPYPFAELARLKAKVVAEGADLIDLGIGDPDLPTPPHIVEAARKAAGNPVTHQYDETGKGLPEFRRAVAQWYRGRFDVELDPDKEVLRLIGAKEGLAHLPWAVINPDDVVLVPSPCYPVYRTATNFAGGEYYEMPLLQRRAFLPSLGDIPAEVAERARLMFLNYPNMPTGAVATRAFFEEVVAFARQYDLLVCQDAAYSEIYYDGQPTVSLLQVPEAKEVAVEMHSLSKTYNMTGWRLGFAVGNATALNALEKIKSNIDSGAWLAIQHAGAAALSSSQECVEQMRQVYQRRRDILVEGLNAIGWKIPKPPATLYVWAPVPPGYTSADFASALLREASILVTPGAAYGSQGEGYVRMSLTIQGDRKEERLAEVAQRIQSRLRIDWS